MFGINKGDKGRWETLVESVFFLMLTLCFSYFSSFVIPGIGSHFFQETAYVNYGLPAIVLSILFIALSIIVIKAEMKTVPLTLVLERLRIRKAGIIKSLLVVAIFLCLLVATTITNNLMYQYLGVTGESWLFRPKSTAGMDVPALFMLSFGLLLGAIGEELFWRGYLLPRQEKQLGKKAWVFNGLFWALSHILVYNPVRILFIAFGFSFIASRYRNITYTIVLHLVINGFIAFRYIEHYGLG
ncbi:MAG TPA: CPBP family intramembrane glutamic endopeptidase [Eudoraea sp.]|nr:CPBP family intramembrane glutamic endopeptidase [Eudoraea sp.]